MSGIRLKLLNTSRRPHSTEPTGIIAPSIPYSCANDPNGNVSFIIKNTNSQIEDQEPKEKRLVFSNLPFSIYRILHFSKQIQFITLEV